VPRNDDRKLGVGFCFLVALSVAFSIPIGLSIYHAQAQAITAGAAAAAGSNIETTPPAGMMGDPVAQPVNLPAAPTAKAQIARGQYLAVAGDCQYCHSVPGGAPYAGGQPVQTPFGNLFTPNITPDKTFGIGNYTDAQFWNVLHNGISPGHSLLIFPRYLYPVMPWQDYNKLDYSDVMAIKAYLDSLQPVAQPDRPSEMHFPFTLRAGLLGWRILFFNRQPIQYNPSWSPQVRNGAFLVQALAHCGECHTQRNILMATEASRNLAGGHLLAQSWYAPNITSEMSGGGLGSWSSTDLVNYLYRDGDTTTGAPYGPMKAVVDDSLSRLPVSDIQDIAAYLQTAVPAKPSAAPMPRAASYSASESAQVYADNCARCHGANGEGVANNFPNLAHNQSVWDGPADNVISMVLGGFQPWHMNQSSMPAFGQSLSDTQIAAVVNYIRTSWGNSGTADTTGAQAGNLRSLASDWVALSTGTMQAGITGPNRTEMFDDISGNLELFGDRNNCMLNASFTSTDPSAVTKTAYLSGTCAKAGSAFDGLMAVDGKNFPVRLQMHLTGQAGNFDTLILSGSLPSTNQNFAARIALGSGTQ